MVSFDKKPDEFWSMLLVLGLYSGYMLFLFLIYPPRPLPVWLLISHLLLLIVLIVLLFTSWKTYEISVEGITVISLDHFRRTYPWSQSTRIFTCTLKGSKIGEYRKCFVLVFHSEENTLPEPMLHVGWYLHHRKQAAIYPYSYQAEQDILKSCPTVPITRLYSKYEDLSN
jgi:hypothetical protein